MVNRISETIETYKPKKTIVIIGSKHLREDSNILKEMERRKLYYKTYIPEPGRNITISSIMHLTYLFQTTKFCLR